MQRVSALPEFQEKVLTGIREVPKFGEFLSPDLVDRLRVLILGKDWQRVDHFPALSISALNNSVQVVSGVAGKPAILTDPSQLLDTAQYRLNLPLTVPLDVPGLHPSYNEDATTAQRDVGFGLTMGDGPNPELAPMHAQSYQLAALFNRLAMNGAGQPEAVAVLSGRHLTSVSEVIKQLSREGHQVRVTDDVYFANFAHLHDRGRDVIMPFWVNTQIAIPASRRSLLVPVSHSEQELHIRGPIWNADVSFYFGIDGKAEFRTMDSLDQNWVMHRVLNAYDRDDQKAKVADLLSAAVRVYHGIRLQHPEIPFGGYYRLGVCQDVSAAVEYALLGKVSLFPITHDAAFFSRSSRTDPRDAEFFTAFNAIPSDREANRGFRASQVDRVLSAIPTTNYGNLQIPGLGADLQRVQYARSLGILRWTTPLLTFLAILLLVLLLGMLLTYKLRHDATHAHPPASGHGS